MATRFALRIHKWNFICGLVTMTAMQSALPQVASAKDRGPASITSTKMDGPYPNPEQLCARYRRSVCENIRFSERDHKSKCKAFALPVSGVLGLHFLDVKQVTADCDNGDELHETHLAVQTKEGWFLSAPTFTTGFQHHTHEQLNMRPIEVTAVGDSEVLVLRAWQSCNQYSAGGDSDHVPPLTYSRTTDDEVLLLIGIGPSGRPSTILRPLSSTLDITGIPDAPYADTTASLSKHRSRKPPAEVPLWRDAVEQNFSLLPGMLLKIEPPTVTLRAHHKEALPLDEREPLCFDGPPSKRKSAAQRRVGSYLLQFR